MNKQAVEFVMDFYGVDRVTALKLYWDEIEAYERILAWKDLTTEEGKDA